MSGRRMRIAATVSARLRGLLFRPPSWLGDGGVLMLVPCSSVHTFFMRYRLDIAFVDAAGIVVKACRDVAPGRLLTCSCAVAVLERFALPGESWYESGDALVL